MSDLRMGQISELIQIVGIFKYRILDSVILIGWEYRNFQVSDFGVGIRIWKAVLSDFSRVGFYQSHVVGFQNRLRLSEFSSVGFKVSGILEAVLSDFSHAGFKSWIFVKFRNWLRTSEFSSVGFQSRKAALSDLRVGFFKVAVSNFRID